MNGTNNKMGHQKNLTRESFVVNVQINWNQNEQRRMWRKIRLFSTVFFVNTYFFFCLRLWIFVLFLNNFVFRLSILSSNLAHAFGENQLALYGASKQIWRLNSLKSRIIQYNWNKIVQRKMWKKLAFFISFFFLSILVSLLCHFLFHILKRIVLKSGSWVLSKQINVVWSVEANLTIKLFEELNISS